jgi:hypothetical protein
MSSNFRKRLDRCLHDGAMTVSDLARWFERPYGTVRKWLYEGTDPWGPAGLEAFRRLDALEAAIRDRKHFPIPVKLSAPKDRIAYMQKVLHDVNGRVPRARAAN